MVDPRARSSEMMDKYGLEGDVEANAKILKEGLELVARIPPIIGWMQHTGLFWTNGANCLQSYLYVRGSPITSIVLCTRNMLEI